MNTRTLVLILASISYIIVIGGATYEHLAVIPQWAAAPPASLAMWQGEYGLNSAAFWPVVHPVTFLLLIVALVLNWRTARRRFIVVTLAGYFLVAAVTGAYYLPELGSIISTPYAATVDAALTARAQAWETLSIVRLVFMMVLAAVLLAGLTKDSAASPA